MENLILMFDLNFRAYKLDYAMFGYDFNDFLKMAGQPPLNSYEV